MPSFTHVTIAMLLQATLLISTTPPITAAPRIWITLQPQAVPTIVTFRFPLEATVSTRLLWPVLFALTAQADPSSVMALITRPQVFTIPWG